ncbi:MAG: hypothetical protein JWN45_786, partial [Acidobacteriaceae bacterium]|nr:hypothetical protein [Acidobacteriaceae bacterium]
MPEHNPARSNSLKNLLLASFAAITLAAFTTV